MRQERTNIQELWPVDGVHPGDAGYVLFADAAWEAYQSAVAQRLLCTAPPKMLYTETYMNSTRVRISGLAPLPEGWKAGRPNVVSAFFDMLMSRWLDDEVIARARKPATTGPAARLAVRFRGSMAMLFGEGTPTSGRYRAYIDGKLIEVADPQTHKMREDVDAAWLARRCNGNVHHAQVVAEGLDPDSTHLLEIEPMLDDGQELRLESICVAGVGAKVERDK